VAYRRVGDIQRLLGDNEKAKSAYDQGISLLEELTAELPGVADYRKELAGCHSSRGRLLEVIGPPREAERAYRRALDLQEKLVSDDPEQPDYRHDQADTLDGLANVWKSTGQLQKAEKAYRQAVELGENLAADFPARTKYRKSLAAAYGNLANLLARTGRLGEAERLYRKTVRTTEKVVREWPGDREFGTNVAATHSALAAFLLNRGRLDEAEKEFLQARGVLKKLADDFPGMPYYRKLYAGTHINIGRVYQEQGRLAAAEKAWSEARKILHKLAADHPKVPRYQSALGATLSNLAMCKQGHLLAQARTLLEEAVRRQQAALKGNPKEPTYRNDLGNHYYNLYGVLKKLESPGQEKALERAVAVKKRLAADFPLVADYQSQAGVALYAWSELRRRKGELKEALELSLEGIRYTKGALKINKDNPNYLKYLHAHYLNRAEIWHALHKPAEVDKVLREAVALLKDLAARHPRSASFQSDVGGFLNDIALLQREFGKPDQARRILEQAIRHQKAALKIGPRHPKYLQFLSFHYWQLAEVFHDLKQPAQAEKIYRLNIPVLKELVNRCPKEGLYPRQLGAKLNDLANLLLDGKRPPEEPRRLLEEAIRSQKNALRIQPGNAESRFFLSNHSMNLGRVLALQGRHADALQACRNGLALRRKLAEDFPADRAYLKDVAQAAFTLAVVASDAIRKERQDGNHWHALGEAHYRRGNWKAALATLEMAMKLRKGGAADWFFLAMTRHKMDEPKEARRCYDRGLRWLEDNKETLSRDAPLRQELHRLRAEAAKLLGLEDSPREEKKPLPSKNADRQQS
jgi:tetratricopeptide (TPR) repeat protein